MTSVCARNNSNTSAANIYMHTFSFLKQSFVNSMPTHSTVDPAYCSTHQALWTRSLMVWELLTNSSNGIFFWPLK